MFVNCSAITNMSKIVHKYCSIDLKVILLRENDNDKGDKERVGIIESDYGLGLRLGRDVM